MEAPPTLALAEHASNAQVFEACWAAHRGRVHGWALRYGGGRTAWAEDLTHDVFVKLWAALEEGSAPEDLGGWLYRVTANLSFDRIRRETGIWARVWARLSAEPPSTGPEGPDVDLEQRAEIGSALRALFELPDKERIVLSMRLLDGASQRAIAKALGVSEGYVSKLLERGSRRVRAALEARHDVR